MLSLIEDIQLRIAEVKSAEPWTEERFASAAARPNVPQFDPTVFEDDDDRWGGDDD